MHIPKQAQTPRPVQVQWARTSTIVEYLPASIDKPRVRNANKRAEQAQARGDTERLRMAAIDQLSELLTGWSFKDRNGNPTQPSRAALARMPDGWLGAVCTAVGQSKTARESQRRRRMR